MKLLTKAMIQKLRQTKPGSTMNLGLDAPLIAKLFLPAERCTWLISEGKETPDGDWLLYGYCKLLHWEWGSVLLSDLETYRSPKGDKIKCDTSATGTIRDNY